MASRPLPKIAETAKAIRKTLEKGRATVNSRLLKRLKIVEDLRRSGNDVEWMVLDAMPVIPPRRNAKEPLEYDEWPYRERHLIECFIGKIKHFRRVFSRFDKLAKRYLGFLQFVSALIWLR